MNTPERDNTAIGDLDINERYERLWSNLQNWDLEMDAHIQRLNNQNPPIDDDIGLADGMAEAVAALKERLSLDGFKLWEF